jgi:VIT1/CCC1 family predicted Fe2+/Mn2+ transporter
MAGVSISLPDTRHVMLAGLANALSGMMAIFFGSFVSAKAQKDFFESQIERERQELIDMPEKERMEVREILLDMGFTPEEAEVGVERITADHDTWLKFMVQEEIGLVPGTTDSPLEVGLISAGSFLLGVIPPFLPFALGMPVKEALATAFALVLAFLFTVGVTKTKLTKLHWFKSGIETLAAGALSCGLGLVLGRVAALLLNRN